jgi:hypothetical protein
MTINRGSQFNQKKEEIHVGGEIEGPGVRGQGPENSAVLKLSRVWPLAPGSWPLFLSKCPKFHDIEIRKFPKMPSKLHDHLQLLRPDERKAFRRFLASPYHNRNPLVVELYAFMALHLYQEPPQPISEQETAAHLWPDQPYDQNRFRKLATTLLQSIREFWIAEALRGDAPRRELYLLRRFNQDQADRFIPFQLQQTHHVLTQAELPVEAVHERLIELGMEAYPFEARQADRHPETRPGDLLDHLEISYRTRKIKLLYSQLNHFRITGEGAKPDEYQFLEKLAHDGEQLPLETQLYILLFRCTQDLDRFEDFVNLRKLLGSSAHKLPADEVVDLYAGLLNYCTRCINQGSGEMAEEMWQIYSEMMDKGLLNSQSKILAAHFKNIMAISARIGKFAWAEQFLDQLGENADSNAGHFGRGVLAFFQGEPDKSEKHFHRILNDFEDVYFGLDARVYLLRIYFETGNLVGMDSLCESFRMYLKRNKSLPRARKANYNYFVNCMRRLGRIAPFDKERLLKLRIDIGEGRRIAATGWLLERVDDLLAKK